MIVLQHLTGPLRGQRLETRKAVIAIGRDAAADVSFSAFDLKKISREHAQIRFERDWYYLIDGRSANGTWVGPSQVTEPRRLREGDVIHLGSPDGPSMVVQFVYDRARYLAELRPPPDPIPPAWLLLLGIMCLTLVTGIVVIVMSLADTTGPP